MEHIAFQHLSAVQSCHCRALGVEVYEFPLDTGSVLKLRKGRPPLPGCRGLPEVCTSCITSQSTLRSKALLRLGNLQA